jgi:hypothetical protein
MNEEEESPYKPEAFDYRLKRANALVVPTKIYKALLGFIQGNEDLNDLGS